MTPRAKTEEATEASDGRPLRRARNHAAIVDAVYELVRERGEFPSVGEVAARARVGERTIFRQFQDLDTLAKSIQERLLPEVMSLARLRPPTGDLAEDLEALIARRVRVFEHIAPFQRASRGVRATSPFMSREDAAWAATMRMMLESVLAPHLDRRDAELLEVIDVLLSFDAWERLRTVQRLDRAHAQRVLERGVFTLLSARHPKKGPG